MAQEWEKIRPLIAEGKPLNEIASALGMKETVVRLRIIKKGYRVKRAAASVFYLEE